MSEANEIGVPCTCPDTPHDTDTVTLVPVLTPPLGRAALTAMEGVLATSAMVEGALASVWLSPLAIAGWTKVDEKGEPLPINALTIAAHLGWTQGAMEILEAADSLYAGDLFVPLARRRSKSSASGPTDSSTSANPRSGSKRPKHSRRSSPNGTAGTASAVLAR